MYIHEAAKRTGTTKKAIEYYCQKGLLSPQLSENGYRDFSREDVDCLKKIALLRGLGVAVEDIRELLGGDDGTAFSRIIEEQENAIERRKEQNELLKELAATGDWDAMYRKAAASESRQSVTDRLTAAFPGFWGKYLSLHFGRFLQEPVRTRDEADALRKICEYLDGVQFEIPEELEACFDEMDSEAGRKALGGADAALAGALRDPETWLKNNREIIERYLAFRKTDEYKNSPGAKLMELLKRFNEEQGYNSIFIPAMRRLSPAYDAYLTKLHEADRVFLSSTDLPAGSQP